MATSTPNSMAGGMLTPKVSSRMMQDAGASTWPPMGTQIPAGYSPNQRVPVRPVSRPIFTVDPLAVRGDKTSSAISFVLHVVGITLILLLAMNVRTNVTLQPTTLVPPLHFRLTVPPMTLPVAKVEGGGGGGGAQ